MDSTKLIEVICVCLTGIGMSSRGDSGRLWDSGMIISETTDPHDAA